MATNKIAIRQDTAANWTSSNPTLVLGEMGFESDTGAAKRGDGSTTWTSLAYLTNTGNGSIYLGGTAAANLLDDYEEGTWTPVLNFGGSSAGITYSTQVGTYTKIGNTVRLHFTISLSYKGSATGAASIRGVPFVAASVGAQQWHVGAFFYTAVAVPSQSVSVAITDASSELSFFEGYGSTGGTPAITDSTFGNNTWLRCDFVCQTI